jgi:MFS family permease
MTAPRLPLFAIIFGATTLQVAHGVLGVIVPLQLRLAETSTIQIGIVVAAYSIGFLAGCFKSSEVVRPVGHIRAFSALAAVYTVSTVLFVATDSPMAWAALRMIGGFSAAGLFAVIESWVTDQAPANLRGRVLAIYMVFNKAGIIIGQLALAFGDGSGIGFFLVASCFAALSIIPVSLTRADGPPTRDVAPLSFRELYQIAPIGVVGCIGAGLVNPSMVGLIPVYGLDIGLAVHEIPILVMATQFGSLILQWPLGFLSDRIDRRSVIVIATLGSGATSLLAVLVGGSSFPALVAIFALWGGFALSIYSVCIVHAGDYAKKNQLLPLVSSLMLAWAIGASVGPSIAAFIMEVIGAAGLMYYGSVISVAIGGFAVWRMYRRAPIAPAERDSFVNIPATSLVVAELVAEVELEGASRLEPDEPAENIERE